MKQLDPNLQAHLESRATKMCYCWKLTRTDGVVQGFTDHDNPLTFGSVTYIAYAGFTATQVAQSLGLAVDNLEVEGALSDATINEDYLARGVYDGAVIELYWVNWSDVTQRHLVNRGTIGEVKRNGLAFSAELRGLANALQQKTGRKYQRYCDAVVGDSRCKVNLSDPAYLGSGTVASVASSRVFTVSGLGAFADDWFTAGVLTFTTGANDNQRMEVKQHNSAFGVVTIELWQPMPFDVSTGEAFTITAGCKQDAETCHEKFANITNFRGFNLIPGQDLLLFYPTQGEANLNGGSLFTNDDAT